MPEKTRKKLFYIMIALGFLAVTIYEFLTPNMSDDIIYWDKVAEANSFFDLFRQEAEHYITHTGRSVAHIILRIFLYINIKGFFNVVAGAVFMLLSLLIYYNVQGRKTYDIRLYGFILALMWFMDPAIANTVFWDNNNNPNDKEGNSYYGDGENCDEKISFYSKRIQKFQNYSQKVILQLMELIIQPK